MDHNRRDRTIELKCAVCGEAFVAASKRKLYCETCDAIIKKVSSRVHYQAKQRCMTNAERIAKINAEVRIERGLCGQNNQKKRNAEARCLYCGRKGANADGYCLKCRHVGLDEVHKFTGRSNGWERRILVKTDDARRTAGGWRGQKVAGGCSARGKVGDSYAYKKYWR